METPHRHGAHLRSHLQELSLPKMKILKYLGNVQFITCPFEKQNANIRSHQIESAIGIEIAVI